MISSLFFSISWEHCYSLRQHPTLIQPRPPRILDPANPANNLYVTGVSSLIAAHERCGEHKVGGGNWRSLCNNIESLDLSKPMRHWIWLHLPKIWFGHIIPHNSHHLHLNKPLEHPMAYITFTHHDIDRLRTHDIKCINLAQAYLVCGRMEYIYDVWWHSMMLDDIQWHF